MGKKNGMKFLVTCALLIAMLFTLTACDGSTNNTTTASNTTTNSGKGFSPDNPVRISIDEWIGYQNLLDANDGLVTGPDSINAKMGIYIEYVIMNNANDSSNALISGNLVGAGYTVNRYAFLQSKFDEAGVDVVMPFIGWLIGDIDLSQINITLVEEVVDAVSGEVTQPAVVIGIGTLLVTIIDFLIIAFIVFLIIKFMAKAKSLAESKKKKEEEVVVEEPKAPTTEELLTEILAEMRRDKK